MPAHEEQKSKLMEKLIKPLGQVKSTGSILNRLNTIRRKVFKISQNPFSGQKKEEKVSRKEEIEDLKLNPNENMDRYSYLYDLSQEDFDRAHKRLHEIRFHDVTRTYDVKTKTVRGFISDDIEKQLLNLDQDAFDKVLLRLDQAIASNVTEHFSDDNRRYLLGLSGAGGKMELSTDNVLDDAKFVFPLQNTEPNKRDDWLNNYRKSVKK